MELKKYKLADIAKIEISGVDKKTIEGKYLFDCAISWTFITTGLLQRIKPSILCLHLQNKQK